MKQQSKAGRDILQRKKEGDTLNIGEEKLIEMIERANKSLITPPTELQFSIHEATKQISVKVTNTETKEVIREIPPEKILDMVAKMWELAGLIIDEKA
ncbi:flagellar protein FlaG [Clostridium aceticum]|nr:flagellar protein FlaG [Clostridium aceticum]